MHTVHMHISCRWVDYTVAQLFWWRVGLRGLVFNVWDVPRHWHHQILGFVRCYKMLIPAIVILHGSLVPIALAFVSGGHRRRFIVPVVCQDLVGKDSCHGRWTLKSMLHYFDLPAGLKQVLLSINHRLLDLLVCVVSDANGSSCRVDALVDWSDSTRVCDFAARRDRIIKRTVKSVHQSADIRLLAAVHSIAM